MESPAPPPPGPSLPAPPAAVRLLHALVDAVQARVISGLVLALPIVLTFWIVYWLYTTLKQLLLDPLAGVLRYVFAYYGIRLPGWMETIITPVVAMVLVVCTLYFFGLFIRSWVHRAIDAVFYHVPVVTTIYKALSNVFQSLADQFRGGNQFQRVVLVEFPHPGMRALAFVTNTLQDATTGKTILCVCVLTGVMPPTGFTLYVPAESVTDLDWSVNQTLQSILSGGLTSPAVLHYHVGVPVHPAAGPIIDAHGKPIDPLRGLHEPVSG